MYKRQLQNVVSANGGLVHKISTGSYECSPAARTGSPARRLRHRHSIDMVQHLSIHSSSAFVVLLIDDLDMLLSGRSTQDPDSAAVFAELLSIMDTAPHHVRYDSYYVLLFGGASMNDIQSICAASRALQASRTQLIQHSDVLEDLRTTYSFLFLS